MANERQSGQHGEQQREQRASNPTTENRDLAERGASRRQGVGGGMQRAQSGEYQHSGSLTPYSSFEEGPFAMMRRLSDEMDRLFEGFGIGRGLFPSFGRGTGAVQRGGDLQSLWSPRVEMFERGNKLVVALDLPGIDRNDVEVNVDQDGITIQGERRQENTTNERGFYRSERSYGRFHRHIPLPEGVNPDSAQATFHDGVLEIETDAPQPQSHGRKLEIKEGPSSGSAGSSTKSSGTH
jgi:HSP20 family protein